MKLSRCLRKELNLKELEFTKTSSRDLFGLRRTQKSFVADENDLYENEGRNYAITTTNEN